MKFAQFSENSLFWSKIIITTNTKINMQWLWSKTCSIWLSHVSSIYSAATIALLIGYKYMNAQQQNESSLSKQQDVDFDVCLPGLIWLTYLTWDYTLSSKLWRSDENSPKKACPAECTTFMKLTSLVSYLKCEWLYLRVVVQAVFLTVTNLILISVSDVSHFTTYLVMTTKSGAASVHVAFTIGLDRKQKKNCSNYPLTSSISIERYSYSQREILMVPYKIYLHQLHLGKNILGFIYIPIAVLENHWLSEYSVDDT